MGSGEYTYLWQAEDWPQWRYDLGALAVPLAAASRAQGMLMGRLADAGLAARDLAGLNALTQEAVQTSAIEGEALNVQSVRSSLARRLGVPLDTETSMDPRVEGLVAMMLDATLNCAAEVTRERLFGWHAALFPSGYSGLRPIRTGVWRTDVGGPMQVVSGPIGREQVHFQAPPAERLEVETGRFLDWVNGPPGESPVLQAGIGHLWLVTLHPFEDGNGRIARALGELLLARAEGCPQRFYSLSAQIQRERRAYYHILEHTQKGGLDITDWLAWFLATLLRAVEVAQAGLDGVLAKARFWQRCAGIPLNGRQVRLLNLLLEGFQGKLTTGKWAVLAKCSQDTALRDISELLGHGLLVKSRAGGRSTSYELDSWAHI
jgi:Fic family protein